MKPPAIDDGDVRIWQGDALATLRDMPSESVHMAITSPPFWGLRDYGTGTWKGGDDTCDHAKLASPERMEALTRNSTLHTRNPQDHEYHRQSYRDVCGKCGARRIDQQIGLEATPDQWCASLVAVFRELRRVLRTDGTLWLEIGDSYANVPSGNHSSQRDRPAQDGAFRVPSMETREQAWIGKDQRDKRVAGLKQKDLVGAPWLLAFALRADGWYLRSDIIWSRPNPMPESVTDRPTKAHSYVFLLTKAPRYYYDADAIRETHDTADRKGERRSYPPGSASNMNGGVHQVNSSAGLPLNPAGRNARSVWQIATEPTPFAHFATFPQKLVERCILAGTSEHGCCAECGAPWRRVVERGELVASGPNGLADKPRGSNRAASSSPLGERAKDGWGDLPRRERTHTGWEPTCTHHAGITPAIVCDPFMGSGTTALVARRLGRHSVGIELSAEYLAIARTRLQQLSLLGGTA